MKSPAMPSRASQVGRKKGKPGVLIRTPKKKSDVEKEKRLDTIRKSTSSRKPLEAMRKSGRVNAGPLRSEIKPNSMEKKGNKRTYVIPKPKSTAKPVDKKIGKKK
jgi:hypothetical protein